MTELLEKAFAEASKLSAEEQDYLAGLILDELSASDKAWDESFERSRDVLRTMAARALKDRQEGRTLPIASNILSNRNS